MTLPVSFFICVTAVGEMTQRARYCHQLTWNIMRKYNLSESTVIFNKYCYPRTQLFIIVIPTLTFVVYYINH